MPLWLPTTYQRCDYPRRITKNRWRYLDAQFHDGARRILKSVLPIKAANNSFMTDYNLSEVRFPRTHDQKLLTLHWRSFSWWGREGIAICFGYRGSQKLVYDLRQPIGGVISRKVWRKIVDTLLTLILQWLYPQYVIIQFGTIYHSHCFGCLSGIFIYFLLDDYVVL